MSITWSYSNLSLYQQCPKKYYHLRIAKDIKEAPSDAIAFGNKIHKIAQEYVESDKPIPAEYAQAMQAPLDKLKAMPGEKLCEYEMGITADLEPCGFKDERVWYRGIADLLIIDGNRARILDYKTGKKSQYADLKQLEILALALFKHYPHIKKVKAGLMFFFADDFVKADYSSDDQDELWGPWVSDVGLLEDSVNSGVWNAKPNFTCRGYCPVTSCAHNQGERK